MYYYIKTFTNYWYIIQPQDSQKKIETIVPPQDKRIREKHPMESNHIHTLIMQGIS